MRVAIGQVEAGDADAAHIGLKVTCLFVIAFIGAGDAEAHLHLGQRIAGTGVGKDRHAVETLLPVPDRGIADRCEVGRREALVLRLDLLQAGDRGAGLFEPFNQARAARLDAVDVEGGDFHARACAANRSPGLT